MLLWLQKKISKQIRNVFLASYCGKFFYLTKISNMANEYLFVFLFFLQKNANLCLYLSLSNIWHVKIPIQKLWPRANRLQRFSLLLSVQAHSLLLRDVMDPVNPHNLLFFRNSSKRMGSSVTIPNGIRIFWSNHSEKKSRSEILIVLRLFLISSSLLTLWSDILLRLKGSSLLEW